MQLTARQRYFARIMVWALPVSAALGAVFGGFNLPNDIIRGYIRGAVAGTLISATALLLEFVVFSRTLSALVRRVPFLLYLALRSLAYLVAHRHHEHGGANATGLPRHRPSRPCLGSLGGSALSLAARRHQTPGRPAPLARQAKRNRTLCAHRGCSDARVGGEVTALSSRSR